MPFTLPVFNITCNVYRGPWLTKSLAIAAQPCNLAWGRRVNTLPLFNAGPEVQQASPAMIILLPPGVDIRSALIFPQTDVVEVPAGSGRWYEVLALDDIGKGFANEHRAAYLFQISVNVDSVRYAGCVWPVPVP